jgi:hypothetical protein
VEVALVAALAVWEEVALVEVLAAWEEVALVAVLAAWEEVALVAVLAAWEEVALAVKNFELVLLLPRMEATVALKFPTANNVIVIKYTISIKLFTKCLVIQ